MVMFFILMLLLMSAVFAGGGACGDDDSSGGDMAGDDAVADGTAWCVQLMVHKLSTAFAADVCRNVD